MILKQPDCSVAGGRASIPCRMSVPELRTSRAYFRASEDVVEARDLLFVVVTMLRVGVAAEGLLGVRSEDGC